MVTEAVASEYGEEEAILQSWEDTEDLDDEASSSTGTAEAAGDDGASMEASVRAFYAQHVPGEVLAPAKLSTILFRYKGREEALFADLRAKYQVQGSDSDVGEQAAAPAAAESNAGGAEAEVEEEGDGLSEQQLRIAADIIRSSAAAEDRPSGRPGTDSGRPDGGAQAEAESVDGELTEEQLQMLAELITGQPNADHSSLWTP